MQIGNRMEFLEKNIMDLVIDEKFQDWVRKSLPLREFCPYSELEIMEEAAAMVHLLERQKVTFSQQAIDRKYNLVLSKILFK